MFVINFVPVGVCSIAAEQILITQDYATAFKGLGTFVCTVISGLLIHGIIILPIIYGEFLTTGTAVCLAKSNAFLR